MTNDLRKTAEMHLLEMNRLKTQLMHASTDDERDAARVDLARETQSYMAVTRSMQAVTSEVDEHLTPLERMMVFLCVDDE